MSDLDAVVVLKRLLASRWLFEQPPLDDKDEQAKAINLAISALEYRRQLANVTVVRDADRTANIRCNTCGLVADEDEFYPTDGRLGVCCPNCQSTDIFDADDEEDCFVCTCGAGQGEPCKCKRPPTRDQQRFMLSMEAELKAKVEMAKHNAAAAEYQKLFGEDAK